MAVAVGVVGLAALSWSQVIAASKAPKALTPAEVRAAWASMSAEEQAARPEFSDPRYVVLSYDRSTIQVDPTTSMPVGSPMTWSAAKSGSTAQAVAASTPADQLTLTVSVAYDREATCCRFDVSVYWKWKVYGGAAGEDSIAAAWANGLAISNDYAYGYYVGGTSSYYQIPTYRSDAAANTGVGWSFNDWRSDCGVWLTICNADWGALLVTIKENSFHYNATNVVAKYFHTYQSANYSLGFSPAPSVSISPTSNQWSLATYTSFND
jgi:hypothetical protein